MSGNLPTLTIGWYYDHKRGGCLLTQFAVSKMCHCWSALGQAVPMEDRLTTRTACPTADKQWHVRVDSLINQSNPAVEEN